MARLLLLVALCVLPALATGARLLNEPDHHFTVLGKVYCDTCKAGFETKVTTYMSGARVKVSCKDRLTLAEVYSKEGETDANGIYRIAVDEDHQDQICDVALLKSSDKDCSTMSLGREAARVILTDANGISSRTRYANAMGFEAKVPLASCAEVLKLYQEEDD